MNGVTNLLECVGVLESTDNKYVALTLNTSQHTHTQTH